MFDLQICSPYSPYSLTPLLPYSLTPLTYCPNALLPYCPNILSCKARSSAIFEPGLGAALA
ncbi:hypothetical protein F9K78_02115 [Brucella pseudintermedia]|nr:hypothetical protein F9K78_02115 [Brucella pseudintermedia]